ncbi:hypothetical protein Slin15195_G120790 [Septoria linicola]|uniref:Uncharacterized protein n=1 Tax=Septoria linicola TaxID=215465 RepID=A0A9Q9B163_9PEZI|nr:hypothetical protein Slin15195_G120790 [Septoria linicola]
MASEDIKGPSPLLRLPTELRENICYYAMGLGEGRLLIMPKHPPSEIPLFAVNHQVRSEAMSIFYKEQSFVWTFENFDARAYIVWCKASPMRLTANVDFSLNFDREVTAPADFKVPSGSRGQKIFLPRERQLWPNLLYWLEQFFHRRCLGVPRHRNGHAAGGAPGLINTAARLFELVRKLGKVHDMSWEQVEGILQTTQEAIGCANSVWTEVIDLDFV